jgi:hypothetical protein
MTPRSLIASALRFGAVVLLALVSACASNPTPHPGTSVDSSSDALANPPQNGADSTADSGVKTDTGGAGHADSGPAEVAPDGSAGPEAGTDADSDAHPDADAGPGADAGPDGDAPSGGDLTPAPDPASGGVSPGADPASAAAAPNPPRAPGAT